MMQLYHGSTVSIECIDLLKSRPNKDFGTERAIAKLTRI